MIINYLKKWGNDGTCYTQTIKIDGWIMLAYNRFLQNKKREIERRTKKTHIYHDTDLKILNLDELEKGTNYTNLIHLDVFLQMINELNKRGYFFDHKRILWRNTIVEVI